MNPRLIFLLVAVWMFAIVWNADRQHCEAARQFRTPCENEHVAPQSAIALLTQDPSLFLATTPQKVSSRIVDSTKQ